MRISDWSSDVCSSDLIPLHPAHTTAKPDAIATRPKPINPSLLSPLATRPHHQPAIPDLPRNQPIPPTTPTAPDTQPANATTIPLTNQCGRRRLLSISINGELKELDGHVNLALMLPFRTATTNMHN